MLTSSRDAPGEDFPPSVLAPPCSAIAEAAAPIASSPKPSKVEIRSSLKASTLDGVFSTIFSCVTAEILLSNFLLQLGASNLEMGFLLAIPMLANFLQPVGAYLADKASSRLRYSLRLFGVARLLWLILVLGTVINPYLGGGHQLVYWTLFIALLSHILGALGSASWVSWMAVLVPSRLRGRYFGWRNSAGSLTNLLCVPLLALIVANWRGGAIQAYGIVLVLAVLAGLIGLGCQMFMVDVNPQASTETVTAPRGEDSQTSLLAIFKDANFLKFLFYCGFWMFAINLSTPFFNIYLLKELNLNVSLVSVYSSLTAGANVLLLTWWGKLADRVGNRPILLLVGVLVAIVPLLWLRTDASTLSLILFVPLLYLLTGGTWSVIELCNNNLQMTIAPIQGGSKYFAIAAAVSGLGGAMGASVGGVLAEASGCGFAGLFALSALLRLVALIPLILVQEPRSCQIAQLLPRFPGKLIPGIES